MKRTEIVDLLREAARMIRNENTINGIEQDAFPGDLENAANSLVILRERLEDVVESASCDLNNWKRVMGHDNKRSIVADENIRKVREFNT